MSMVTIPANVPIPVEVLRIAKRLEEAGHQAWCVGGAVRDTLLGFENADFDLATSATPDQVREVFRRTIPVGIAHGTVAVLDRDNVAHEVTTFRKDIETDGRHAVVEFGVSLENDLARRDFTVNAIAYHPTRNEWVDPFGGQADLAAGLIRAVGNPAQRFREDFLRILRGFRFAARFEFEIHEATWEAAREQIDGIAGLSAERVRGEWMRGIETARDATRLLRYWDQSGALSIWLPELLGARARHHPDEAADESMALGRLDNLPDRDPVLVTSYLSSDPAATLARLKCSTADVERGRRIAMFRTDLPDAGSLPAVRRWMARVGQAVDDLVVIAQAETGVDRLAGAVGEVRTSGAPLVVPDMAVDGADLMSLGMEQGPAVGQLLSELLQMAIDEPSLNTKETLMALAAAKISAQSLRGERDG